MSENKTEKHQIKVETLRPIYDVVEDRIRLSVNHNQESNHVDFMMTRKFLLQMLPVYEEYLMKVDKTLEKKVLKNRNARLESHTQLKPYQESPELLMGIEFAFIQESEQTNLSLQSNHTVAILTLSNHKLAEVFNILRSVIPYFDWGISPRI